MHIGRLHGPSPVPTDGQGEGVYWSDWLASTEPRERTIAVDAHRRTIDAAAEVGARAIVIHLGNSGVVSRQATIFDTIARTGRGSDEHLRLRDAAWQERQAASAPHLSAALDS